MDPANQQITALSTKVRESRIPDKLKEDILLRLDQLSKLSNSATFLAEFDRVSRYVEWVFDIPWGVKTEDVLNLEQAKTVLDRNHHGLDEIKDRILEYLSIMKLKSERGESQDLVRAPILCFVGLVGTGKTTVASSIAEALGRKFARIPFGGMGDPLDLRGQSRMHAEAEPGKIIKALKETGSMNPVILLDEIDRVATEGRASIMGVLVELLDPKQNHAFVDHYIDSPVDLSRVLFVATANNTNNIATAVLDRLEPISMPSYSDTEKIEIARNHLLPRVLKDSGVSENELVIKEDVWPQIVRPLGYDAGIRTLERTIDSIVRKVAKMMVEGKARQVEITQENVKDYLPR